MSPIIGIIGLLFNAMPIIQKVWQKYIGRTMEITIKAHYEDMGSPYTVTVSEDGTSVGIYALLDLRLVNHSPNRAERIIECWAELRKRYSLRHRVVARFPVLNKIPTDVLPAVALRNVYLEPISRPQTLLINIIGDCKNIRMPKRSELIIVFKMVGPIRRLEYKLTNIIHSPKDDNHKRGLGKT